MVFHRNQSLVHVIFNIFLCDLFDFLEVFAVDSYADDNTSSSASKTNDLIIKEIDHFSEIFLKWFDFNYMEPKLVEKVKNYSQEMTA